MKLEDDLDSARIEELLRESAESGEPILLTESEWDLMMKEACALVDLRRGDS